MEQGIIIAFLNKAGFEERGKNQYFKKDVGFIHIRKWDAEVVFNQIIELGEKHYANKLRDLLKISDQVETYVFNPQV